MNGGSSDGSLEGSSQGTPLFESQHFNRYARQELIREYQARFQCRLVVLIGDLEPYSVPLFEEILYDASPDEDLHVLLSTAGGDAEVAVRLARQAQLHARELSVVVPDIAKSAGTLFVLGAHRILMGSTSDLGPTDPQFRRRDGGFVAAKSVIAAVDAALDDVVGRPETLELHAALLAGTTALDVQKARDALAHADDLLLEALMCQPDRSRQQIDTLVERLKEPLIGEPNDHGASISADRASNLGLPIVKLDPASEQWRMIWRLWARYFNMGDVSVYEGERASQIFRAS